MIATRQFAHMAWRFARPVVLAICLAFACEMAVAQTAPADPPSALDDQSDAPSSSVDIGSVVALDLPARPALVVNGSAEWDDGLDAILRALDTVHEEMAKSGLTPNGKPLSVFTETDDQGFKFTAMVPLSAKPATPPALGQKVTLGETPAGKAMKFQHRGSYDDIDTSYEAITAYLDEKGLEAQNLFVEEYLTTPKGADDSNLEVDIYVFLK